MGSTQRYTEDEDYYELDDEFIQDVRSFGVRKAIRIGKFLDRTLWQVPNVSGQAQIVGGVIDDIEGSAFFFAIELYKDDESCVTFFGLSEIDDDEYLDLINSNSYLNERMDINTGIS